MKKTSIMLAENLTDVQRVALGVYKPPFRYDKRGGYIWDAGDKMVSDEVTRRAKEVTMLRGWGNIKYLDNPINVHDAVGELIALALTQFWENHQ